MRFERADLPGIAIAALAPPALFLLFLASYETWNHQGTPLLGFVSSNIAIAVGVMAVFTRFVRRWEPVLAFFAVLVGAVVGVLIVQQADYDGTALATTLKWVGVVAFLLLNAAIGVQVLVNGLLPVLDRRAARRAAEAEAAAAEAAAESAKT